MGKRANRRGKPKNYKAPLQARGKDGILRSTTTWPWAKREKGAVTQDRLENIEIAPGW